MFLASDVSSLANLSRRYANGLKVVVRPYDVTPVVVLGDVRVGEVRGLLMAGLGGVMREEKFCIGGGGFAVAERGEFGSLGEIDILWDSGLTRGFVFCLIGGVVMERPLLLRVR